MPSIISNKDSTSDRHRQVRRRQQKSIQRLILILREQPLAKHWTSAQEQSQASPIIIVKHDGTSIEFTSQDTTWVAASAVSYANFHITNNPTRYLFVKYLTDIFPSEHCRMTKGFDSAFAVDHTHRLNNNIPGVPKASTCCEVSDDSDPPYSTNLTDYTSQLIENSDGSATAPDWRSKLSTARVSEPLQKQNRMKVAGSGAKTSSGADSTNTYSKKWKEMYERLLVYKTKHNGDTNVPRRYGQDPRLGQWVHNQRTAYKTKAISSARVSLLGSIGFDWVGTRSEWNEMYQRLVVYKKEHSGNTDVPHKYKRDSKLGYWVSKQRQAYKNKILSAERVSLLDSIGFGWLSLC